MLHGRVLRSPHAHASILSIDTIGSSEAHGRGGRGHGRGMELPWAARPSRICPSWRAVRSAMWASPWRQWRRRKTRSPARAVGLIKVQYEELPAVFWTPWRRPSRARPWSIRHGPVQAHRRREAGPRNEHHQLREEKHGRRREGVRRVGLRLRGYLQDPHGAARPDRAARLHLPVGRGREDHPVGEQRRASPPAQGPGGRHGHPADAHPGRCPVPGRRLWRQGRHEAGARGHCPGQEHQSPAGPGADDAAKRSSRPPSCGMRP